MSLKYSDSAIHILGIFTNSLARCAKPGACVCVWEGLNPEFELPQF